MKSNYFLLEVTIDEMSESGQFQGFRSVDVILEHDAKVRLIKPKALNVLQIEIFDSYCVLPISSTCDVAFKTKGFVR